MDDIKVSHEDESLVKDIMSKIDTRFGGLKPHIEKEQVYLGMNISFNDDKTVLIQTKDYVKKVIATFDGISHVSSATSTPALNNLFMVDTRLTVEAR